MKFKKFIIWQFKQWLPLFVLMSIWMAAVYLISCLVNTTLTIIDYSARPSYLEYPRVTYPLSNILVIFVVAIILTYIVPLFVYNYRFNKKQVDTFMQAPFSNNNLRITRILIGLAMILISLSVIYFMGVIIVLIKQTLITDSSSFNNYEDVAYLNNLYNYGHYFTAYLFIVVFISIQYFINCLFVSFSDNLLDAIMITIFANTILLFFIPSLLVLFNCFSYLNSSLYLETAVLFLASAPSFVLPSSILYNVFDALIVNDSIRYAFYNGIDVTAFILNITIYVILAGLAIYKIFFVKDPSGEFAGRGGPRSFPISLFLHGFFFLIALLVSAIGSLGVIYLDVIVFVIFGISYYGVLAIYNRRFKIDIKQISIFIGVMSLSLVLLIATQTYTLISY